MSRACRSHRFSIGVLCLLLAAVGESLAASDLSLEQIVTPSTLLIKDGHPVTFTVHGFVEFSSLAELFAYVQSQTGRWSREQMSDAERRKLAQELLHRGIESRIVSMADERPLEVLITHTSQELREAISQVKEPVPDGYAEAFLAVQDKWKHSLNCWSASPSIAGRVLSNWYPIEEGIQLYGVTYDSTEHFWQAVKYHGDVTISDLLELLYALQARDWHTWLARLDEDPRAYLPNAYAVEFLRHNLVVPKIASFRFELQRLGLHLTDHPRELQQRGKQRFRFTAFQMKTLWGDLADLFHLVYLFSAPDDPIRQKLAEKHFDGIYLGDRKIGFISSEFQTLMLDIWKVKYLQMPRFRELISSIPLEIRLEHFLNDGDSPDIPIPVYVEYLNQIRELARAR